MTEEAEKLIKKAEHAMEVAEKLLQNDYPSDAVSKTYYAMFYAAQALLKSEGIDVTKHSAVESAVGYHFAKAGKIDPKFHRMLIDTRKVREVADYDIEEEVTKIEASLKLKDGKTFLRVIKKIYWENDSLRNPGETCLQYELRYILMTQLITSRHSFPLTGGNRPFR